MTGLWQMQRRLAAAVVHREASAIDGWLAGDPARAAARISVYSNNHHLGLRDALTAIYPVVGRVLGSECFELLARDYVDTYPKPSGNLLDFGEFLAELIAETSALSALPYLADLARLEWQLHQVDHAADSAPEQRLSLASLAALDDRALATLRLRRGPATQLFQSRFPVLRIWHSNQDREPTPVSLSEGGVKCLLLRAGLELRFEVLSDAEFAFLAALDQYPACIAAEVALQLDARFDLALTLARWLNWLQPEISRSPL